MTTGTSAAASADHGPSAGAAPAGHSSDASAWPPVALPPAPLPGMSPGVSRALAAALAGADFWAHAVVFDWLTDPAVSGQWVAVMSQVPQVVLDVLGLTAGDVDESGEPVGSGGSSSDDATGFDPLRAKPNEDDPDAPPLDDVDNYAQAQSDATDAQDADPASVQDDMSPLESGRFGLAPGVAATDGLPADGLPADDGSAGAEEDEDEDEEDGSGGSGSGGTGRA